MLELFIRDKSERLVNYVFGLVRPALSYEDARDIAWEAISKCYNMYRDGKVEGGQDGLSSLIFRSAKNLALNELKRLKVKRRYAARMPVKSAITETNGEWDSVHQAVRESSAVVTEMEEKTPEYLVIKEESEAGYELAVASLTPEQREVWYMNRDRGMTQNDIAEAIGLSTKAVEKRIQRCLVVMKKEYQRQIA